MSSEDETIRQLLVEIRLLEGSARAIQSRLEVINAAISEMTVARNTLEGVRSLSNDADTLVPVGGGSFLRAKLADVKKVVVGVGAGVAIEKDVDTSIEELKGRLDALQKAGTDLQTQFVQAATKLEDDRAKLNELVRSKGGDTVALV